MLCDATEARAAADRMFVSEQRERYRWGEDGHERGARDGQRNGGGGGFGGADSVAALPRASSFFGGGGGAAGSGAGGGGGAFGDDGQDAFANGGGGSFGTAAFGGARRSGLREDLFWGDPHSPQQELPSAPLHTQSAAEAEEIARIRQLKAEAATLLRQMRHA